MNTILSLVRASLASCVLAAVSILAACNCGQEPVTQPPAPNVVDANPAFGSTAVPFNKVIEITFDMDMDTTAGTLTVDNGSGMVNNTVAWTANSTGKANRKIRITP